MEFYRGRMVVEEGRYGPAWKPTRFLRVWSLRSLITAFLLGLLTGVALGYAARALRVPGFVKYQVSEIAVDDQRFRRAGCHHVSVWATAMRAAVAPRPSQGRSVDRNRMRQPLKKLLGMLPAVRGGRGESPEPLSGRG